MIYRLKDFVEMGIGTFSSALLFVAIRSGEPGPFLDQTVGIIIFGLWTYILYRSFIYKNHTSTIKYILNVLVAISISILMAYTFRLAILDQMLGMQFFSSPALIIYLIGLPVGLLYEKMNVTSLFAMKFISKKY